MGRRRRVTVPVEDEAPKGAAEPEAPIAPEAPTTGEPEPEVEDDAAPLDGDEDQALLDDEAQAIREADESVASGQVGRELESLELATHNIDRARVWAERADLYRSSPDEFRGVRVAGYIRRWDHPFDAADIESWARKYRGGGKFKIMLYGKDRRLKRIHEFACEGNPILPGTVSGEDEEAAGFAPPTKPGAGPAATAATSTDDRVAALEKLLLQQKFEHQLEQQQLRASAEQKELREQMRRIEERLAAKAAEPPPAVKPGPTIVEMITAAVTAVTPIALKFVDSQKDAAARAEKAGEKSNELTMKMIESQADRTAEMLKVLAGRQEKPGEMLDMLVKLKGMTQGGEGAEAKAFSKIIDHALPALIHATTRIQMHQAGVRDDGDDEPPSMAERLMDKAGEVLGGFFSSVRRPAAAPPAGYGPPMAGGAQPAPTLPQIPPGPRGAAMLGQMGMGQSSIVVPRGAPPAAAAAPAAAPAPPAGDQGPPLGVVPTPAAAPAVAPPPAEMAPGPAIPDINDVVLQKALLYMSQGKSGSELADELMQEEEAREKQAPNSPPLYLSKRVITLLCTQPPDQVLPFILPYIAQDPRYAALTDALGVSFLKDFCCYFSEPEDDEGVDPITGAARGPGGQ